MLCTNISPVPPILNFRPSPRTEFSHPFRKFTESFINLSTSAFFGKQLRRRGRKVRLRNLSRFKSRPLKRYPRPLSVSTNRSASNKTYVAKETFVSPVTFVYVRTRKKKPKLLQINRGGENFEISNDIELPTAIAKPRQNRRFRTSSTLNLPFAVIEPNTCRRIFIVRRAYVNAITIHRVSKQRTELSIIRTNHYLSAINGENYYFCPRTSGIHVAKTHFYRGK